MLSKIKKYIDKLENSKDPIIYFVLSFFFICIIRNFIELYSDLDASAYKLSYHFHYTLFYISLALSLIMLFYYLTKENIGKVSKIIFFNFFVIIIGPLLDLLLSGGKGFNIEYLAINNTPNLLWKYFTFFGIFRGRGVTPGIRVEIVLVLLASLVYFFIKSRNIMKSILSTFLEYNLIFIYFSIPIFLEVFMNLTNLESAFKIYYVYLFLLPFQLVWIFAIVNKEKTLALLKDIRFFRLSYFMLLFILGIIMSYKLHNISSHFFSNLYNLSKIGLILFSIAFAWIFSVITNNIADKKIDKISSKNRPLIKKIFSLKEYTLLSIFFLFLAIIYAISVSYKVLFLVLLFIGIYFLYSMPPFRLKRIPIFSKFLIASNSLICILIGNLLVTDSILLSKDTVLFFLILFPLAINFIDIKDYKGDKKENIKTLPTIMGLKNSKILIGFFLMITNIAAYFWLEILQGTFIFIILLASGVLEFILVNRKNYSEKPLFIVYLVVLITIAIKIAV